MKVKRLRDGLKFLLFLFLVFICQTPAYLNADDMNPYFYRGNDLYEKGKYEEAVKEYSRVIEKGYESGSLYYNLGNSYFKKGEPGMAILNYERAKRLIPGDKDLESNYKYALSLIKGELKASQTPLPLKALEALYSNFTINDMVILLSLLYTMILLTIALGNYMVRIKKTRVIILSLFIILFMVSLFPLIQKISLTDKEAIITAETAEAGFEPIESATTHYTLYEGMKVQIVQTKEEWCKVKRPDGKKGWVAREKLEMI